MACMVGMSSFSHFGGEAVEERPLSHLQVGDLFGGRAKSAGVLAENLVDSSEF